MANLGGILGTMLATGLAGRSRRGPAFSASPFGMAAPTVAASRGGGFRQTAGLAALAYLGYRAYQDYQKNNAAAGRPSSPESPRPAGSGGGAGDSLGQRLAGLLRPEQQRQPEAALGDQKALLLIRAMIAAANADGEIDTNERQRILGKLDDAGASAEDKAFLERELASPQSVDTILRDVQDEETAEQVYLASRLAIDPDSPAERSYLQFLAARLKLDPARTDELNQVA